MNATATSRSFVLLLLGLMVAIGNLFAQAPSWWTNRNVIATNAVARDFTPVNQGQVKWLAMQAAAELDEDLQFIGGAGDNITALVASFSPTNNYRPVNAGQLKNTVQPLYDRLFELGLTNCYPVGAGRPYPWSGATNQPNDYAMVNIGQAKYLFSFDFAVDSDGDGIPDIWEKSLGTNPYFNDANAVNTNAWAQGQTNSDLYQSLHTITIPNAWAVYTNTTQVAVVADIRSLNRYLTVKAAEFFLDTTNGVTFGTGTAMSAMDGTFNSTNEMAQAIFTPSFPAGERHAIFIHAQGSDNRWCSFVKVILNPTINDILDRIQANYSAIQDLSYDVTATFYIDGELQDNSGTFHVQQKRGYMLRQTDASTGLITIMNANRTVYLDGQGQYQGGFEVETIANMQSGVTSTNGAPYYWDTTGFRGDFPGVTNSMVSTATNGVAFQVTPQETNAVSALELVVDRGRGIPVQENYYGTDGVVQQICHESPALITTSVWFPTSERVKIIYPNGRTMEWRTVISNIRINQGLADALFAIPNPPEN